MSARAGSGPRHSVNGGRRACPWDGPQVWGEHERGEAHEGEMVEPTPSARRGGRNDGGPHRSRGRRTDGGYRVHGICRVHRICRIHGDHRAREHGARRKPRGRLRVGTPGSGVGPRRARHRERLRLRLRLRTGPPGRRSPAPVRLHVDPRHGRRLQAEAADLDACGKRCAGRGGFAGRARRTRFRRRRSHRRGRHRCRRCPVAGRARRPERPWSALRAPQAVARPGSLQHPAVRRARPLGARSGGPAPGDASRARHDRPDGATGARRAHGGGGADPRWGGPGTRSGGPGGCPDERRSDLGGCLDTRRGDPGGCPDARRSDTGGIPAGSGAPGP